MPDPTPPPAAPTPPPAPEKPAAPAAPAQSSFYDDLDALAAAPPKERPAPPPKKEGEEHPPTRKDAAESTASDTEGKSASGESSAKTAESSSQQTKSDSEQKTSTGEAKPVKAAELRTAYENLKKEHQALKAEHEKIKSAKPAEDPDKAKIIAAIEEKNKRIEQLESELKYTSYEKSEEYQTKYQKPFEAAYQQGRARAAAMTVTNDSGETRQGKSDDFDAIMLIGDDNQAADRAAELFGNKAPAIMYWRERVQELHNARASAVEEYRKQGSEREKTKAADEAKRQADLKAGAEKKAARFHELNTAAAEKYPQWFKPEDGDEEGNARLEKGMKLVDAAFFGAGKVPEEKLVELHSMIRMKAGGFDRVVHKLKLANDRVKELETELEQFKKSEPGADSGKRGGDKKTLTVEEEIDALAAARR